MEDMGIKSWKKESEYCFRKRSPYVGSLLPLGPEVLGTEGFNQSASIMIGFTRLLNQHSDSTNAIIVE
jgi:hypothetical protein